MTEIVRPKCDFEEVRTLPLALVRYARWAVGMLSATPIAYAVIHAND